MEKPIYPHKSLASIESLSRRLSISKYELLKLAEDADQLYFPPKKPKFKSDGSIREIYRVGSQLKNVQHSIVRNILSKVTFPRFLQGGVRGRDYISNAKLHSKKRELIREDIAKFFPSIKAYYVKAMWQHCFHFSKEVAEVLTKLTTYRGAVPQGAQTSTYIGNLIFWDLESALEDELRKQGFDYSRFVDDTTVSTNSKLTQKERNWYSLRDL